MGYDARVKKLTSYTYSPTIPSSEDAIREQIDDAIQETFDNITDVLEAITADDAGADSVGTEGTFGTNTVADEIKAIKVITDGITSDEFTHKNYLINGAFDVWQRGTTFTPDNVYTADRWYVDKIGDTNSQIVQETSAKEDGFKYALKIEQTSITGAADSRTTIEQPIEDVSIFEGQSSTFTVRANFPSGQSGTLLIKEDGSTVAQSVITGTGSFASYTISRTHASSLTSLSVFFLLQREGLAVGEGAVIQWAKFELGDDSTALIPKSYSEELLACQRYYFVTGNDYGSGYPVATGYAYTTDVVRASVIIPVQLRVAPTLTITDLGSGLLRVVGDGDTITVADTDISYANIANNLIMVEIEDTGSFTLRETYSLVVADYELAFDAEI